MFRSRTLVALGCLAALWCAVARSHAAENELRKWRDSTRMFEIDARFKNFAGENVVIVRADGTELTVPIDKLSASDRQYLKVQEALAKRAAGAAATQTKPTQPTTPATSPVPGSPGAGSPGAAGGASAAGTPKPVYEVRKWGRDGAEGSFERFDRGSVIVKSAKGQGWMVLQSNQLNEDDRNYLRRRTVTHPDGPIRPELVAPLETPDQWAALPDAASVIVIVEAKLGDAVKFFPAVIDRVDQAGVAYLRAEGMFDAPLESTMECAVLVRNPDQTTRRVPAQWVDRRESTAVFTAAAGDLPPPRGARPAKAVADGERVFIYGFQVDQVAGRETWRPVRSGGTFYQRGGYEFDYDIEAGEPPLGSGVVTTADGTLAGFARPGRTTTVVGPDGKPATRTIAAVMQFDTLAEQTPVAEHVTLSAGAAPGTAEIHFLWRNPTPVAALPRLVIDTLGPHDPGYVEWVNLKRSISVQSITVNQGEVFRVRDQMIVLECAEVKDPQEIARRHPRWNRYPQGTRAMKAGFRYDPAILGDNFQIAILVLRVDPQTGKYLGNDEVRFEAILSGGDQGLSTLPALPPDKPARP